MADKFFTIDTENFIMAYNEGETPRNEDAERFSTHEELQALIEGWPAQRTIDIFNAMPIQREPVTELPNPETAAGKIWDVVSKIQPAKAVTHKEPIMKKQSKAAPKAKPEPKPKKEVAPKKTKAERKAERAALKAAKKEARATAQGEAKAKKSASKADKKAARKAKKAAKAKTPKAPKAQRDPGAPRQAGASVTPSEKPPREGSKGEKIAKLMLRDNGATLNEIARVLDHDQRRESTKDDPLATSRGYLSGFRQRFAKFYTITSEKEDGGKVRRYKAVAVK